MQSKAFVGELESAGIALKIGKSKLDRLYLNKKPYFDNIKFSGRRDAQGWQEVKLSGHNPFVDHKDDAGAQSEAAQKLGSEQFVFVYGPPENGRYRIRVEAQNQGSLVSAVNGRNIMRGGYLVLDGDSQGPFLTKPIQADFKLNGLTEKSTGYFQCY